MVTVQLLVAACALTMASASSIPSETLFAIAEHPLKQVFSSVPDEELLTKEAEIMLRSDPDSAGAVACFLCRQLLAASTHRVGISQTQLSDTLHSKCRRLPSDMVGSCISFANKFLQEIYFSLNYDFSAKNVCVALHICEKNVDIPDEKKMIVEKSKEKEIAEKEMLHKELELEKKREKETRKEEEKQIKRRKESVEEEKAAAAEEKRLQCMFCDRMLESVKMYAEGVKADIDSFSSTACARWPRKAFSEECHKMAEERIAKLAKFVDEQVVESLWCSELYQCN